MAEPTQIANMVQYQFEISDEVWNEWKDTVPRSKTLDTRIIELIEADRDGKFDIGDEDE